MKRKLECLQEEIAPKQDMCRDKGETHMLLLNLFFVFKKVETAKFETQERGVGRGRPLWLKFPSCWAPILLEYGGNGTI